MKTVENARKTQTEKKKKDENETRQRLIVYGNLKYRKTGKNRLKEKKAEVLSPGDDD